MDTNLIVFGLILDLIGVFILVLINMLGLWHRKQYQEKWTKKYWWVGWRPFYKNSKTKKWHMKLNYRGSREGAIPPKHQWEIVGFLCIGLGFISQIIGNLR